MPPVCMWPDNILDIAWKRSQKNTVMLGEIPMQLKQKSDTSYL